MSKRSGRLSPAALTEAISAVWSAASLRAGLARGLIVAMPSPSDAATVPAASGAAPGGITVPTLCTFVGLLGLGAITLASPGATRMYAWPWVFAYWAALLAPVTLLILRVLDSRRPWVLPGRAWIGLTLAWCGVVLASTLASPYRGPTLLWSAPLLAAPALFLALFDWLHASSDTVAERSRRMQHTAGFFLGIVALASLALWLGDISNRPSWRSVWLARNAYPLGHSNYTAGLTLLMLPCFVGLALGACGRVRLAWWAGTGIAVALLFTSGSRGGFGGLAVLALAATPAIARKLRVQLWLVAIIGLAVCALLFAANPRIRGMLTGAKADAPPNASKVQRSAMLEAGLRLGTERPILGWGAGATPLAYPRVRAGLEGGAENVLQLHSLPVQLWAELGGAGVLVALGGLGLAAWSAFRGGAESALPSATSPNHGRLVEPALAPAKAVLLGLSGYLVFSLTDSQLDVPVFAAGAAVGCALLASRGNHAGIVARRAGVVIPVLGLSVVGLLGQRDLTPVMNIEGLVFASNPATTDRGIGLLRSSLVLNPDQEIAHFNLGWLLVVKDSAAAEKHFLAAARLVPDKGGVWFGLGLARLNQNNPAGAARAFALEGLNDPAFLFSPWWKAEMFASLRKTHAAEFIRVADAAASQLQSRDGWLARESRYVAALTRWALDRSLIPDAALTGANRAAFFQRDPQGTELEMSLINAYRRERTGYPVLMRQPDLPPPSDVFTVQENAAAAGPLRFLFPDKGWLPAPLLLEILDPK